LTSRLPVRGLDDLPGSLSAGSRLYVKPLAGAWRSAGASMAAPRAEVLLRTPDAVLTAEASVADVRAWSASLDDIHAVRAAAQLDAIAAPCEPIAGLAADACHVMGIVNVTPDSFSDGGQAFDPGDARSRGLAMVEAGATALDIGGESTRPGSDPVPADEEMARVVPAIEALAGAGVPLSIDSRKASVMTAALDAGAAMVNDVSALTHDPGSMALVAERGVPVVLMHALSDAKTMQDDPAYDHASLDIFDYLESRIEACLAAGIARGRIVVDPGIGFGKTLAHNLILLRDLSLFRALGCPILLGASRKSFIGRLSGEGAAGRRMPGSVAVALAGAGAGAHILRVHDVPESVQAVAVWTAIQGKNQA